MSFQIGIANLVALVAAGLVAFKRRNTIVILSIALFCVVVFFITPFSSILWSYFPFVGYIQFPWRLLSVVILLASFVSGSLVADGVYKSKKTQAFIAAVLVLLSVLLGIRYAKAPFYHEREDSHYLTRSNFTDGTNSPGDAFNTKWLSAVPKKAKNKVEILKGEGEVINVERSSVHYRFQTKSKSGLELRVNVAYFPG